MSATGDAGTIVPFPFRLLVWKIHPYAPEAAIHFNTAEAAAGELEQRLRAAKRIGYNARQNYFWVQTDGGDSEHYAFGFPAGQLVEMICDRLGL